jgi:putative sugar O-methyltransferase
VAQVERRGAAMIPDFILPSESIAVSEKDYRRFEMVCEWITRVIGTRDAYISEKNLDVAINNPAANWSSEQSFYDGYRALVSGDRRNIGMMRVFSQMFSGFYLGLISAHGLYVPRSVPDNIDDVANGYRSQIWRDQEPWWVTRYKQLIEKAPMLARLSPPKEFGETGFVINGVIVNHDTYAYLERVFVMQKMGVLDRLLGKNRPIILEIGSGYGALSYYVKQLIPGCVYICLDLPECLIFSALYMTKFHDDGLLFDENSTVEQITDHGAAFVPNYMFDRLVESGLKIDLAINTLSMSEMSEDQVSNYCRGIEKMLNDDGAFFEQNHDNRHVGLIYSKDTISKCFDPSLSIEDKELSADCTNGVPTIWKRSP